MSENKKATTKVVAKPKRSELLWLGGQTLLGTPATQKEQNERATIELIARCLNVSVFGINVLGGNIYLNKLGLSQKAHEYYPRVTFKYNWINIAKDDKDKAICQCKVMDGEKELSDWVLGECSPATMKMGTLNGYQNHMAQTRAKNRAILEVFGVRIHEEMLIEVEALKRKSKQPLPEVSVGIGNSSVEEIQRPTRTPARPAQATTVGVRATKKELDAIKTAADQLGINTSMPQNMWAAIQTKLKIKVDWNKLTKTDASQILFKLLEQVNN